MHNLYDEPLLVVIIDIIFRHVQYSLHYNCLHTSDDEAATDEEQNGDSEVKKKKRSFSILKHIKSSQNEKGKLFNFF